jgi:nitrogen fixation-related uncharacterized protein
MQWTIPIIIIAFLGVLFFASAVYALHWASKTGQFRDFEKGARTVFDEEEPEGVHTDFFPGQEKRSRQALKHEEKPDKPFKS